MSAWIPAVVIGAEHWYSSETLWVQISVVVALLIGVLTLLVTWIPRQRLYYWAPPATPLLVPGMRGIADLEIRHDGQQLADPYLLEVTLTTQGRRDIPSSAFDQGRPLVFDLGAGIVKVLQVRCSPVSSLAPPVTNMGSNLMVGPELVGRRQTTTISVLVDGGRPHLVCTQPVLEQVTLIPAPLPPSLWGKTAVPLLVPVPFWLALAVALAFPALAFPVPFPLAVVLAVLVPFWLALAVAEQWLRRRDNFG